MSGVPSTAENAVTAPPAAGGEVASANSTQDSSVLVTGVPLCPPHPPATAPAAPAAPAPVSGQPAAQQTEQPTQVTVSLPVATQGVAPLPAQFALSRGHPSQPGGAAGVVPVTHASPFALPPGSQVAPMLQHMPPPLAPLQPSAAAAAPVASVSSAPVAGPTVPYHDLLLRRQDQWSNFPAGLRVLVADNDPASLQQVEKMLKKCSYKGKIPSSPLSPPRPHLPTHGGAGVLLTTHFHTFSSLYFFAALALLNVPTTLPFRACQSSESLSTR
jgi:hypothetical protein